MPSYSLDMSPQCSMENTKYWSSYNQRYRYSNTVTVYGSYGVGSIVNVFSETYAQITLMTLSACIQNGTDAIQYISQSTNSAGFYATFTTDDLSSSLTAFALYYYAEARNIDSPSTLYNLYSSRGSLTAPSVAPPINVSVSKIQETGTTITWTPKLVENFVTATSFQGTVYDGNTVIASFSNITSPAFLSFTPEPTKFYDFSIQALNYVSLSSGQIFTGPKQYEAAPTSVTSLSLTDFYPSSTTQNVSVTWLGGLGGSNTVNFMFGTSTMPYVAATYDNVSSGAYLSLTTTPGYQYSFVVTSSNRFGSVTSTNSNVVYTDLSTVTSPCITYMDRFYQSVTWGRIAGNVTYDVLTFIGSTPSFSDSVFQGKNVNVQPGTAIFNAQRDDSPYNFITVNAIAETGAQSSSEPSVPFYWKKTSTTIPYLDLYYLNNGAAVVGWQDRVTNSSSFYGINCSSYVYSLFENTVSSTNGMTFLKTNIVSPVNYDSNYRQYVFYYPYTPGMYYMCQLQYIDNIGQRKFVQSNFQIKG